MKLNSARISEFQSIRDSNPFEIGDITCLVGKNEAGKTALLRALYRINPIIASEGNFDATEDYPRADVEDYRQDIEAKKREPANVVEATFALSDLEIQSIESEFEEGILTKAELTLTKGYDNHLKAQLPINKSVAVKSFIKQAQLPSQLEQDLQSAVSLDELSRLADLNQTTRR